MSVADDPTVARLRGRLTTAEAVLRAADQELAKAGNIYFNMAESVTGEAADWKAYEAEADKVRKRIAACLKGMVS